jgi:hypothetical protein
MATGASSARENEARETQEDLQTDSLPLEEQIRRRAHEIWLKRGGHAGSDVADWLEAEREITREERI